MITEIETIYRVELSTQDGYKLILATPDRDEAIRAADSLALLGRFDVWEHSMTEPKRIHSAFIKP